MKYLGDLTEDQVIDFKFSTHQADGTPITLAGSPVVKVYKGNAIDSETDTGVTLSVDHDGVTGMHHVRIDTSDAFYAVANDYSVVITTGTVDSVSVVGTVLATFSIENRFREADVTKWLGQAVTLSTGNKPDVNVDEWKDVALATTNPLPNAVAGAANGLVIAGSNAATTFAAVAVTGQLDINDGIDVSCTTGGRAAIVATGNGAGPGFYIEGGDTASGLKVSTGTGGTGKSGLEAVGVGTTARGITATGVLTDIHGDITGNMDGSVGSVTGAVGSVTGAVGSVTGAVGSVTAGVGEERGRYAMGAVWIGPAANTNTVSYVDGIITNPVSTLAAAKTIADALKLRRFMTVRSGTIQMGADYTGYDFDGDAWQLTTTGGSRDVSSSNFHNAKVTGGTYASTSAESHWGECEFSTGISVAAIHATRCTFAGTLTLNAAGNYEFIDCASVVAGTSAPVFAVPAGVVNISFRRWSGGISLTGITADTTVSIDMVSGGTVTLAGADGNVQVRGLVAGITDNRTGTPVLGQNAAVNITKIAAVSSGLDAAGVRTALGMASDDMDNQLDAILVQATAAAGASGGTGPNTITITVVDDLAAPLESVSVGLTKGAETPYGSSDAAGQVLLYTSAGTFTLASVLSGYQYTSATLDGVAVVGGSVVVTGNHALAIVMTRNTIAVTPSTPPFCTGYTFAYNDEGVVVAGVTVTLQTIEEPTGDEGKIYSGALREAVSDANGLVLWEGLPIDGRVKYWRGESDVTRKRYKEYVLAAAKVVAGIIELPSLAGSDNVS